MPDDLSLTAAAPTSAAGAERTPMRGIHHLALTTDDLKSTIDFYTQVMRMPLVHALKTPPGITVHSPVRGNPPFECIRHYFFDMGNDSLLAFFEIPKGAKPQADRDAIGGMQHVSFVVKRGEDYEALMERLTARGISFFGPKKMESGPGYSIYFFDPNGLRLEASCDPEGPGSREVLRYATQTKAEVRDELRTLSSDAAWIESVIADLSD